MKLKMSHMFIFIMGSLFVLVGCDNNNVETVKDGSIELPKSSDETVKLSGIIDWWFWEGDGGCFGTIDVKGKKVELWSNPDRCEGVDFQEGDKAQLEITYRQENQYGEPGVTMYTVVHIL